MKTLTIRKMQLVLLVCIVLGMSRHTANAQNLVANPGFENGTNGWHGVPGERFEIDKSVSHAGVSSLKFSSKTPSKVVECAWYKLNADPGHRYKIGAWAKLNSFPADTGGVAVDIVWFDKTTKVRIASKTSRYLIGSDYDWVYVYCETPSPMPANVGEAWVILQVRAGSTGTAWFDDVTVEKLDDTVFQPMYKYPNYRHTILPDKPRYASVVFDYSPGGALRSTSTTIKTNVVDAHNKVVASVAVIPAKAGTEEPQIRIDLSDVAPGTYTLTSDLVSKASGKIIRTAALPLIIAEPSARLPKVYIDSQNRCIVDGKPFFPRGFYMSGYADISSTLSKMASAGFNTTLNYSWAGMSLSTMRSVLDDHSAAGMRAIACVNGMYDSINYRTKEVDGITGNDNMTRYVVNGIKQKPALLAYYINDELYGWMVPQLQHKYDLISGSDPNHLVYQVLGFFEQSMPQQHLPNCDVIGYDIYPLKDITKGSKTTRISGFDTAHLNDFYTAANRISTRSHNSVANWMVPQCCAIDLDHKDSNIRPPNYNEELFFSYQAIVNGARGLVYWYYSWIRDYDGEAQWDVMKRVGAHLTTIEPLVLADDADTKHSAVASDKRVKIITRERNGKLYILAVNSSIQTVTSRFSLPMPILKTVYYGLPGSFTNKLQSDASSFSDRIDPMETRIYELSMD